jgi:putative ABC transport system ATP-binding protein
MVTEDHLRTDPALRGSLAVLRRGLRESPELRRGLWLTVVVSLGVTVAELTTPLLVQQVFDRGLDPFRPGFVWTICAVAFLVVLVTFVGARIAGRRLVRASELALRNLRVRTFRHIHRLSIADQSEEKRGVFVARVTADVDALQEFMEWGGVAWIVSGTQAAGALVLMLVFSWQLTLAIVLLLIPMLAIVGSMQARLTQAFNVARTRVGQMLSEVSESVMGAAVVRAYGLEQHTHAKVRRAIDERYRAEVLAHLRAATLWPMATAFYAIALAVVVAVGSGLGPDWGLTLGRVTAFLFLATVFLGVFMDLPEIYAETQTAIAGWRKILAVLDLPLDVVEPAEGERLASGPLPIVARGVRFAYRDGPEVLLGISLDVPAGAHVAIVGATGCGKTTFAKLLARVADPTAGTIEIGGIDLRRIDPDARRSAIRMVPQDGFLFDATIGVNVRLGRPGATERDARAALEELGLGAWVDTLPQGLATPVGERGEALSAGERQLVALARAHIGDPGLLILDEATSAVDPATERQITEALRRASEGRTTVTIAHRLSTAEAADRVFVFDAGRLVESGTHAELVRAGGVYARLYDRWLGNTGSGGRPDGDGRP